MALERIFEWSGPTFIRIKLAKPSWILPVRGGGAYQGYLYKFPTYTVAPLISIYNIGIQGILNRTVPRTPLVFDTLQRCTRKTVKYTIIRSPRIEMLGNFTSEWWLTSVPWTLTPQLVKVHARVERDTYAEPKTAKINRNLSLFDKSRVCPRANKVFTPISRTVKNVSPAYLSLWWLHKYSKAAG